MDRVILHCDLNNFFASVECLKNPKLREVPMAVCGNRELRHGIVLAKNPIAKAMRVKTGEAVWQAKQKCPDLVTVLPNHSDYVKYSRRVREVYERFTDVIEPFGIDECWLDVTGSTMLFGGGEDIARKIGETVKRETGLTISTGVSFNKVFAKLGSGIVPPDSICVIGRSDFCDKIWGLPVSELLWVGRNTERRLKKSLGIFTVGDLATADPAALKADLGKQGELLYNCANGLDDCPVCSDRAAKPVKSVGNSTTPPCDMCDMDDARRVLLGLSAQVSYRLREQGLRAGGVVLSLRDGATLAWRDHTLPLTSPTSVTDGLYSAACILLEKCWNGDAPLRSIGVRAINLEADELPCQCTLYESEGSRRRAERMEKCRGKLRDAYGDRTLVMAAEIQEKFKIK